MRFVETFRMAGQALRGNLLRSSLTLLGIGIGVFSVIASVTAVQVIEDTFVNTLAEMGSGTFTITRLPQIDTQMPSEELLRRPQLTVEQGVLLQERARLPAAVGLWLMQFGVEVRGGGEQTEPNVRLVGADEHYAGNNGLEVGQGRFLSADDVQHGRAVVVLGTTVAERLFGGRDALGKGVRAAGRPFRVVGVLREESGGFGLFDPNNVAVIPLPRLQAAFNVGEDDVTIDVRAPSVALLDATRDEVIGHLRAIRRVRPEAENDFEVTSSDALVSGVRAFTGALKIGGAGIGLIALLAAGIGVMNILLVSVTERTREIGIRKAVGATRSAILRQFLLEAVLLCQVGGVMGILAGVAGGNVVALMLKNPPAFPWGWALGAVLGMVLVAIGFGVYPAWKAASLEPIESLRYE